MLSNAGRRLLCDRLGAFGRIWHCFWVVGIGFDQGVVLLAVGLELPAFWMVLERFGWLGRYFWGVAGRRFDQGIAF